MTRANGERHRHEAIAFLSSGTLDADTALMRLTHRYGNVDPDLADIVVALGGDGLMLQVTNLDGPEQPDEVLDALTDPGLPWGWQVFRTIARFTKIELESGREETRELAMTVAEAAASAWR